MEPCIICTELTPEGLKKNALCPCKYYIHTKCWAEYERSTPRVRCLMCRKNINSTPKPSAPPASHAYYHISTYQLQPTYQEVRSTVSQTYSSVPGEPPIRVIVMPPDATTNERIQINDVVFWKNKITSIIVGVLVIVAVLVLLILML